MKISDEVANVLGNSRIEGVNLYLPDGQLDRKIYLDVNKVLITIKGKWNRKAKAHVFDNSPHDKVEEILLTGQYIDQKKEYQFFETPSVLAQELVDIAGIKKDETVLEPSAGKGRIAKLIDSCDYIEINKDNRAYLKENGFNLVGADFLDFKCRYDVIIANPPFSKQQDIDHVNRMIDLANRRIVSVMSASLMFRNNKKTNDFRKRIELLGWSLTPLPDKTFSESGTNVNSCVVVIDM